MPKKTYTVKINDTLTGIAKNLGISPSQILFANPQVKTIRTGMTLKIPPSPIGKAPSAPSTPPISKTYTPPTYTPSRVPTPGTIEPTPISQRLSRSIAYNQSTNNPPIGTNIDVLNNRLQEIFESYLPNNMLPPQIPDYMAKTMPLNIYNQLSGNYNLINGTWILKGTGAAGGAGTTGQQYLTGNEYLPYNFGKSEEAKQTNVAGYNAYLDWAAQRNIKQPASPYEWAAAVGGGGGGGGGGGTIVNRPFSHSLVNTGNMSRHMYSMLSELQKKRSVQPSKSRAQPQPQSTNWSYPDYSYGTTGRAYSPYGFGEISWRI
jgi:LysM repeat protein